MNIKSFSLVIFIAAISVSLAAQSPSGTGGGLERAVFSPFVSRLSGEVKNNLVRLSWVDSADARGPVYVYRSASPFTERGPFTGITPVEVPYGARAFVDEIGNGAVFHYFAAASDGSGRRYEIPIASENTIRIAAAADGSPLVVPASPEAAASQRRGVFSIAAEARDEAVLVTFSARDIQSAAVYRSIRPITTTSDLLSAVIVQTQIASPFTDYPVPGIPYYYAVIPEEDLIRGTVDIIPGGNATLDPAAASVSGAALPADIRPMPLPRLSAGEAVSTPGAGTAPSPAELSPDAAKALALIPAPSESGPAPRKPRVFAKDLSAAAAAGGEDYALSLIVKGAFSAKNWEGAREELADFLALPRGNEVKTRARFYLGQCCYFLSRPREGLFEFLSIQERYPHEAAGWIDASLEMIKNES